MTDAGFQRLIDEAESVLNPVRVGERWFGDVAAAVESAEGHIYTGICIDTGAGGFCAERSAVAAMVVNRDYQVAKVVAVWRDSETADDRLYVLPPCGVCRQFLQEVHPSNIEAEVILSATKSVPLRDLLPLHGWAAQPARALPVD